MNNIILKSEKLNKHFGITHAVKDISLEFERGEIHGLIGENGSGKSTFCSMLCGIYTASSGQFFLENKLHKPENLIDANKNGISIIVQEIGTLSGLTVAENIFLGAENKFMTGIIKNTKLMNTEAQKLLDNFGFKHIKASAMIDHYSFEDRKLIEIVKATYFNPKVVVIDETTTALSQSGRTELFRIMHDIKTKGNTVIFISHDLDEIMAYTDRISVLRDGNFINTVKTKEVNTNILKNMMVGRELEGHYYRTDYNTTISKEIVLSVKNVTVKNEIKNISFDLHRGEILGFGGLSECGMHEVGKAIFGASYGRKGFVTLANGTHINTISTAIKNSIAYASKDRDNESVIIANSISANICIPSLKELAYKGLLNPHRLTNFANKYAQMMSVKMTNVHQEVSDLSGGNKQKVVLARWIGKGSDILVFDSPTRGIDVKVKADIYALMEKLKEKGKSIIMISEEIPELIGMSDRILIMKDGYISGEFFRNQKLSEEDLIEKMI